MPVQNAFSPAPVSTTARTSVSSRSVRHTDDSSTTIVGSKALCTSGRSSVTVATPSATSSPRVVSSRSAARVGCWSSTASEPRAPLISRGPACSWAPGREPAIDTYETLLYEERDGVAIITLNRPEVHNAFNLEMQRELHEMWRSLRLNRDIRCVIWTGAGDEAFCT